MIIWELPIIRANVNLLDMAKRVFYSEGISAEDPAMEASIPTALHDCLKLAAEAWRQGY